MSVDPKTVFEPYPDPQNSPLRPQKPKAAPKLSKNPKSLNLRNHRKSKLFNYISRPGKQFLNFNRSPKKKKNSFWP